MKQPEQPQISPVTFRLANIGPVKKAEVRLGGLTVIAGRNNTGKTYIAYSLYGFLKSWRNTLHTSFFLEEAAADFPQPAAITNELRKCGRAEVSVSPPELFHQRKLLAAKIGRAFSPQLRNVFNSRRDSFRDTEFRVEIDDSNASSLPSPATVRFQHTTISMCHDGKKVVASTLGNERLVDHIHEIQSAVTYFVFLLQDVFPDPFILSAERFGISLFYRELDFTKNQLVDLLQKLDDDGGKASRSPILIVDRSTSRYATPIKDNIDFTRGIPDLPRDLSPLADRKLHDHVKNMMSGYYSNANDDIRFISKARKKGRFNIPLHLASSSARGLSDLYFFLRYSARYGQLLIIDEPESHLDTHNQVQFARLLARFVSAGLRVVITTHSDYIVKELNNLIMLSENFPDKKKISKRLGYLQEDELKAQFVRGYVAENGGLSECNLGQFGIDMPVFDDTIDEINNAAIELSIRTEQEEAP